MDIHRHILMIGRQRNLDKKNITFKLIYLFSTIFAFQSMLTAYMSSSYIEQFIDPKTVGAIYAIGAAGAIALTLTLPKVLKSIGNVNTILILLLSTSISLVIIGLAPTPLLTLAFFILLMTVKPQIYLNIDIFLETLIGDDENTTGSRRGILLSLMSFAIFLAPLAMVYIVGENDNLSNVYFVSAFISLLLMAFIISRFRNFQDPVYSTVKISNVVSCALKNSDIKLVFFAHFLLQLFYAWAVIYIPLYLSTVVGFDWTTIGQIIAVGLFAFVLLQYPAGRLADCKYGEKEMMAIGFVFLALASASISFVGAIGVVGWMILVFTSRIGASLVEITTESYFFKQVKQSDSKLISLFRLMRPTALLLGSVLGSITLMFLPFNLIFVALGLIMVTGIIATMRLNDTK